VQVEFVRDGRGFAVMFTLFPLAQIVATTEAPAALERAKQPATCFLTRHLSRAMDRWRGLCRVVIQVEAKLELGRIRHEAGMPWWIEHDFNVNFLDTG